jgi:hypothetical protein
MTLHRRLIRSALTLLLAVAVTPAWACLSACNTGSQSLDCLKLCSRSRALLTDNGELPSLAKDHCQVDVDQAPAVLSVAPFQLDAPSWALMPAVEAASLDALQAAFLTADPRGPPSAHPYLPFSHPQANAPPSFC